MRSRLIAALSGLMLLMLLVQDLPLASYLASVEHSQIMTSLERDAWRIAGQNSAAIEGGYTEIISKNINAYAFNTGAKVVVTDSSGIVRAATLAEDVGRDFSNRPEIAAALTGQPTTGDRESVTLGQPLMYATVPVQNGTVLLGVVRISFPQATVDAVVSERVRGLVLVAVLTLLITILAAWLLATAVTRRLRRLYRATSAIAAGDLTVRVSDPDVKGTPELKQLEVAFDTMVERLSSLLESQRSFASDASHQLRTPLTALRLQLENAMEQIDEPKLLENRLEAASGEVVRLQTLVDGLLTLARIEGSAPKPSEIDLTALLESRIEMWRPLADEKQVKLTPRIADGLSAHLPNGYVDQIIDSYLDNALDFAPSGSRIRVTGGVVTGQIEIHVIDEGPGMPPELLSRAFDRFWRGRADDSGTGLGLAIVGRLASAMGAQVGLQPATGGGIDAYLRLPRS